MTSNAQSVSMAVSGIERRFGVIGKHPAKCTAHGEFVSILRAGAAPSGCPACAAAAQQANDLAEQRAVQTKASEERLERKLGASLIPKRFMGKTFAEFKAFTQSQQVNLAACLEYAEHFPQHKADGRCVVMTGTPGTGKTHLASAIAAAVIAQHGVTAVYRTVGGLLQYIKGSYGAQAEYTEAQAFASLVEPALLIIDEVGATKPTEFELATLFAVINGRYEEQLPTIVISNIDAKELGAVLGDRSVDRLREGRGIGLVFEGASERSKRRAS